MVFLYILVVCVLVIITLIFSKLRIEIVNFKFCSQTERHINKDYKIIIKLCMLGGISIFRITLTKYKLEKVKLKEKIKNVDFKALEKNSFFNKEVLVAIKNLDILIRDINLYIDIGTENAVLTSIIVPIISTIIAIVLQKKLKDFENQFFIINPIYKNQNMVNLFISGIFEVKMIHIINIIYMLIKKDKKGVKEYERTSNRGTYDYSYE